MFSPTFRLPNGWKLGVFGQETLPRPKTLAWPNMKVIWWKFIGVKRWYVGGQVSRPQIKINCMIYSLIAPLIPLSVESNIYKGYWIKFVFWKLKQTLILSIPSSSCKETPIKNTRCSPHSNVQILPFLRPIQAQQR